MASVTNTFTLINGRLIYKNGADIGSVSKDVDGYYYYWADGRGGAYSAYDLKSIAEFLDELNAGWDQEVKNYFEQNISLEGKINGF